MARDVSVRDHLDQALRRASLGSRERLEVGSAIGRHDDPHPGVGAGQYAIVGSERAQAPTLLRLMLFAESGVPAMNAPLDHHRTVSQLALNGPDWL